MVSLRLEVEIFVKVETQMRKKIRQENMMLKTKYQKKMHAIESRQNNTKWCQKKIIQEK